MPDFPDPAASQLTTTERVSKLKSSVVLTATGVVLPQTLAEVAEVAQYMCKAGSSIPVQMRDNPGECMGIIMDAMQWGMNPFAVARQCYVVESKDGNQTRAYMSQLITAVIQKFAPIKEKVIAPVYIGDGTSRQCKISVHHEETGELMEYISPPIGEPLQAKADDGSKVKSPGPNYVGIWPKNSPLWRTDPDQQLWYYTIRAWARRFQPGIILGVYDIEEARQMVAEMRDITPKEKKNLLVDPADAPAATVQGEVIPPETPAKSKVIERVAVGVDPETGAVEIEPQVPLGEETADEAHERRFEESLERHDKQPAEIFNPETGEIAEEDARPAFTLEPPPEVTPELMFKNLAKSLADCQTVKDYEQWRSDNPPVDIKKAIGEKWWKQLGPLMTATEDRIGYL